MDRTWGLGLAIAWLLVSGSAHAQEPVSTDDEGVEGATATSGSSPPSDAEPSDEARTEPAPPVTLTSDPPSTPWWLPAARPDGGNSLAIRASSPTASARLYLRPMAAASGEAFECSLPCTALVGPGPWSVSLAPTPEADAIAVNGSPLSFETGGELEVRYSNRGTFRTTGVVLILLGALAMAGALVGAIAAGSSTDGGLSNALQPFMLVPAVAGLGIVFAGAFMVVAHPYTSARWTPDP